MPHRFLIQVRKNLEWELVGADEGDDEPAAPGREPARGGDGGAATAVTRTIHASGEE